MCKFCKTEPGDCEFVKAKKLKIKVGNKVRSEEALTVYFSAKIDGEYTLESDYWIGGDGHPAATVSVPIKYCPFCGRKLHND